MNGHDDDDDDDDDDDGWMDACPNVRPDICLLARPSTPFVSYPTWLPTTKTLVFTVSFLFLYIVSPITRNILECIGKHSFFIPMHMLSKHSYVFFQWFLP